MKQHLEGVMGWTLIWKKKINAEKPLDQQRSHTCRGACYDLSVCGALWRLKRGAHPSWTSFTQVS